jgi:hypothetical protein
MEHRTFRRAFEEYMTTGAKADPDPALHVVNGMAEFYERRLLCLKRQWSVFLVFSDMTNCIVFLSKQRIHVRNE